MRSATIIIFFFFWAASPAGATPTERPTPETVQAWIATGVEAFRAGRHEAALTEFRKAEPHAALSGGRAAVRFNIARCLDELGRFPEAIAAYERYLAFPDKPGPRRRAVARISALVSKTYGRLDVQCEPPGAGLKATGPTASTGTCPARWERLLPGAYTISLFVAGKPVDRQTATVRVGHTATAKLRQRDGALTVRSNVGGATIYVDGRAVGTSPVTLPLAPGTYAVRAVALGRRPWRSEVEVKPARTAVLTAELALWTAGNPDPPGWTKIAPWVLAGVSAASLIAGGIFLSNSQDAEDAADRAYASYRGATVPADAAALRSRTRAHDKAAKDDRMWAIGLLGTGTALAAATVWAFIGLEQLVTVAGPNEFGLGWGIEW